MAYIVKQGATYYVAYREGGRGTPLKYVNAGRKKRDAEKIKSVIESNLLHGSVGLSERKTFGQFTETWLAGRSAQVRRKTEDLERRLVRNYLVPEFGTSMLHTIKRDRIRAWAAELVEQRSRWVARRCVGLLKTILQDAKGDGYLRENPAWDVPLPLPPHREMLVPSVEDVCNVLGALPTYWRPLAFVAALTGLRWGELGALEWRDLDLDHGKLHIRRALPANTREVGEPKSWAGRRTVDLFPCVVQVLSDLPLTGDLVFPGERGSHLNHRWFMRAYWRPKVQRSETGLGLRLRWHDLRHFYASLLFAFGEGPVYVSAQMGHGSPAITLRVYAHLMAEGRKLDRDATLHRLSVVTGAYRVLINAESGDEKGNGTQVKTRIPST